MWAVVVASGVGGAVAHARPAGWRPADIALSFAFGALVSLAGSYARRWSWLVTAGIAVAAGSAKVAVVCAVAAIVISFVAVALNARSLGMGAAATGLAAQALLRLPHFLVQGAPSVVAFLAIVPLFASAYRYAPRRVRRRARRTAVITLGLCVALTLVGVGAALLAKSHLESGIDSARGGFDGVQNGDRDVAVASLNQSASSFGDASGILGSWWAAPVRAVPIIGQQLSAVKTMSDEGESLAQEASKAAAVIDYEQLRVKGGAIDINLLKSVQQPITDTAKLLDDAERRLEATPVNWLLPPVRDKFDTLQAQITRARPAAAIARDVIAIAPQMLGGDVPQHYLVLFGTPAETRELGGFAGNFALVTADKGKLTLTRSGRSLDLSDPTGDAGRTLTPGAYQEPFAQYRVTQFFGNVTASPNFPDVANVAEQLYPQAADGQQVDGVIYMDPYALASLLDLTGPITVTDTTKAPPPATTTPPSKKDKKGGNNGSGGTSTTTSIELNSKNAAHILLVDQYVTIGENHKRVDFLDEATRITFEKLTSGDLPKPVKVAQVMNPMVEQGHLFAHSIHPDVEALFTQLAFDGTVPDRANGDYLSVTQANENPSKIDAYLQRDVTYDATFRPDTGEVVSDVRIKLTNSAPGALLPDDVIGNANGLPPGTNHLFLTVYSPLNAKGATIDDKPTGVGSIKRFGLSAFTIVVDVPPGGTVNVDLKLAGVVARSRQYQLTVVRQPTVNSDHIDVTLQGREGWRVVAFPGFQLEGSTGKASIGGDREEILTARLDNG